MMEYTKQQENEFYALRDEAAALLSKQTLKDNPNITYGRVLSPTELQFAAHLYSPEVKARASLIYTPEEIAKIETAVNWEERVGRHNRKPIDYDMYERHADYQVQQNKNNTYKEILAEREKIADADWAAGESTRLFKGRSRPRDPGRSPQESAEAIENRAPTPIIGLEKAQKYAALGFEPSVDNQIQFKSKTDATKYFAQIALNPRNMTIENYKFLGDQYGLKGEYIYIDPSDPSLGVAFKAEGQDDYQIMNSPYLSGGDAARVILQETPAAVGDIIATTVAAGLLIGDKTPQTRAATRISLAGGALAKKLAVLTGMSGAAATGAAGGEFIRLATGVATGSNNMTAMEIFDESKIAATWAFAGTLAISASAAFIVKSWKVLTGKDVPIEMLETIDDAMQAAKTAGRTGTSAATPGMVYSDLATTPQIREQVDEIARKFKIDLPNYNPTLTAEAGTRSAADLETVFLKYADDPKLRDAYAKLQAGNQEVIDAFIKALNENIGPSTARIGDATGASLGKNLRDKAQQDINLLETQTKDMLENVRTNLGGADDAALAGETLLRQVKNPKASSLPIFERTQTRLNELRYQYTEPFHKAWADAINNERYAGLRTGAGKTKGPLNDWRNASRAQADQLLNSANADEAVAELYKMIPKNSADTIRRLAGRGKDGKFKNPDFSINELNMARVRLNEFASNLPAGNETVKALSRKLEHGLEEQMNILVREGASLASGIPKTSTAKLNRWMKSTGYGDDLIAAWGAQKNAVVLANSENILSFVRQNRPEKVAEFIFNTSAKGSKKNSVMTDLMTILKRNGDAEAGDIRDGLAAYIQDVVLDPSRGNSFQIASNFRQFVKDNEGTLRAVYGEKQYNTRFMSGPKAFKKNVLDPIEQTNENIAKLQVRFGMAGKGDPNKAVTNIVETILDSGATRKQSGSALEQIEDLVEFTKGNKDLETQIAQVTKRWLTDNVILPKKGGGRTLDANALTRLLRDGFGPKEIVGDKLTVESFFLPLLGKDGPEFLKSLQILDSLVQREIGVETSEGVAKALSAGEYGAGSNIEGLRTVQRFLIAPLTQAGRRLTTVSNRSVQNSRQFIGEMLLDPKLFEKTMEAAQGRLALKDFTQFLISYGIVVANDIGNEMKFYDTTDKTQKTPSKRPSYTETFRDIDLPASLQGQYY